MSDTRNPDREPRCEECGFSLAGHVQSASPPRCPECGIAFDVHAPWSPEALPDPRVILWKLCSPLMVVLILLLVTALIPISRDWLIWPFLLIWISAIGTIGFVWPIGWTYETVRSQVPRRERNVSGWRWLGPALVVNSIATIATILGFWLLL